MATKSIRSDLCQIMNLSTVSIHVQYFHERIKAALVSIKRKQPVAEGVLLIPVWVPFMVFICSTSLVLFQLLTG